MTHMCRIDRRTQAFPSRSLLKEKFSAASSSAAAIAPLFHVSGDFYLAGAGAGSMAQYFSGGLPTVERQQRLRR